MSRKEKLLLRLLSGNAEANFYLDDLVSILIRLGFEERKTGGKSPDILLERNRRNHKFAEDERWESQILPGKIGKRISGDQ